VIVSDEESLPEGWTSAFVRDLVEIRYGKSLREDKRQPGLIPVYGSNGIVGNHNTSLTDGPTIILGRKGSIGAIHLCRTPCWPIDTTYYIHHFGPLDPAFLAFLLRSLSLARLDTSTAVPGINREDIYEQSIAIAPLAEQTRLTASLHDSFDRVESVRLNLLKVPSILKRFRQSVLDAAVTGKLTADWRSRSAIIAIAKPDLEAILTAVKHRPREVDPTEGHEKLTEAIPDEWEIPCLGDLFRFIDYRGKTPQKSMHGKRLISAKNIKMGFLSDEPVEYVSDKTYREWMTRGFPTSGDIFFVTEGHTMGFAALNNRDDEFALSQRIITLQPWLPLETRCFLFFIMSKLFQSLIKLNATGSAAVGIKAAKFRGLPIPFPSLAEQRVIIDRVDGFFACADRIEGLCQHALRRVARLPELILAKGLRGELVPTEAELARREGREFEPASVLLERIRAEKENHAKAPPIPKRKLRKASVHV
jgi:type I restriction enzyme, S subunit